ncbi:site-2 protease family protein [Cyanobacteria bacterium FACHB-471]|nr:site-2 protease family protein [Cyanobacteria bacterium FACHB-471]
MVTVLILLIALGVLGWGFYRARPFGKLGILAWLQSVVLMAPWLVFFGLFAAGIYLNLAGVLLLLVVSIGLYIFLGGRLREAGQDLAALKKFSAVTDAPPSSEEDLATTGANPDNAEADAAPVEKKVEPVAAVREDAMAIPADDLKAIQGIFGSDTFFATETIPYQNGAIFKGNLRGEVESSYSHLSAVLKERVSDRYRLFFVEGPDGKPVVVILPSTNDPKPTTLVQWNIALILLLATIATSLETAGLLLGFDLSMELGRVREVLPIASGILIVLAVNEIGRRISARYHQARISPPYFIPTWQIGSFGALTRFESNLPNRSVLFDIAFVGPAAAGIISLGMLIIGLLLSHQGSQFQIPAEFFQGSILVGTLARVVLGSALQQPLVDIHPLTVIGWLGLVITAINLMPAGQLDGGRIVLSIYGRKVARRTTIATLIVLGLASLVNPLALYWAVVLLFLQRDLERPSLNELSEPDDARAALGLLVLFLMAATLLPITPSLAGRLGIGG